MPALFLETVIYCEHPASIKRPRETKLQNCCQSMVHATSMEYEDNELGYKPLISQNYLYCPLIVLLRDRKIDDGVVNMILY